MAQRTVVFKGLAYGSTPATVQVTANGVSIFSGTITTENQPMPAMPNPELVNATGPLFTMTVDTSFLGTVPMTCEVTAGTVIFADIVANYSNKFNPIYTDEQLQILVNPDPNISNPSINLAVTPIYVGAPAVPPLSEAEVATLYNTATTAEEYNAILYAHNLTPIIPGGVDDFWSVSTTDPRNSVSINGVTQLPDRGDLAGAWWWTIPAGSTMSYDLEIGPNRPLPA
jgi:hypothetical protein